MFVRTKDGVYEVEQSQLEDDEEVVDCIYGQIGKLEIKRKSENLEELCDNIVYNGYLYQTKIVNNELIEDSYEELTIPIDNDMIKQGIYGAIWTDKGLIYVAKLNNKGELELI